MKRTHTCGQLNLQDKGTTVTLSGWVHRRRDHGGLIFIDLRDRFGLTQIVFRPEVDATLHDKASDLRSEWVITITGKVHPRAEGMANPNLATGEIEVEADTLTILSHAKTPPFSICDERIDVNEELRLKFRYLDIRRGPLADNLVTRHKIMLATRNYLDSHGFLEITTPLLGKSTPEGARDFLVPSRLYPGSFFALPQSPQLFKQLLMISGMDRYFQIAPCMRDEDLRADRQPEFTQIDLEMSFGTQDELFPIIEGLMATLCKTALGLDIETPFRRMTYTEAMSKYGCDKPDLRFGMELTDISPLAAESSFSVFQEALKGGGIVKGLAVPGGADISRKKIDDYTAFIGRLGLKGLAWIKLQEDGPSSSIVKFFEPALLEKIIEKMGGKTGDILFFVAAPEKLTNQGLDHLRRHIAREREMIPENVFAFAWITDFPLFQRDEETGAYACEHHPFTSPNLDDLHHLETDPLKVRSSSYDIVLNGYELGSGSMRIHNGELQEKIFHLLKLSEEDIRSRFGFFIEALKYGTPPHMGIALGLDRIAMLLARSENMRDVIAFPKTQKASDLMLEAPAAVMEHQLTELKIHVEPPEIE